ncbi:MAG: phosphatase PAP2 family protein, partial [Bacteroidales bacterium]|nr:phosphatase PAP2 family protein [Bacteroidales bacterium]
MIELLRSIDTEIFLSLNNLNTPFWDSFMSIFSGKMIWAPMYATIVYILYTNLDKRTATFYSLAIILTIALADMTCARMLRPMAERLRPANLDNPISGMVHIVGNYRGGIYGFPSCHAANSFGLATILSLIIRKRTLAVFIFLWATVNAYSRLYLGVHYTGDLLVGAIIGSLIAIGVYWLAQRIARRRLGYSRAS